MVHNNQESNSKVMIGLPIHYRKETIEGVMNHEIGTHFLRKHNDRYQKWYKDRKKFNLQPFLQTEEGLAAINQVFSYFEYDK